MLKTEKPRRVSVTRILVTVVTGALASVCLALIGAWVSGASTSFVSESCKQMLLSILYGPLHWDVTLPVIPAGVVRSVGGVVTVILFLAPFASLGALLGDETGQNDHIGYASGNRDTAFVWYKTTFGKLMIAGPILTLAVSSGLFYVEYQRSDCDRRAVAVLTELNLALNRVCAELKDFNLQSLWSEFSEDRLKYLVGPYYGWRGTAGYHGTISDPASPHPFHRDLPAHLRKRCGILLKMRGNEFHACAMRGRHPTGNPKERHIFRMAKPKCSGEKFPKPVVLKPTIGVCTGNWYGYGKSSALEDSPHYGSSILNPETRKFQTPLTIYEDLNSYRRRQNLD